MISKLTTQHMQAALALGRRGLGRVWPNPAVGCVIADTAGYVVGRGWTQPGGRPHAETEALKRAGDRAKGGTAYVTLEPCSHTGQTPPCAEALINAGIARVVVALQDPDGRVSGRGIALLEAADIAVERNVLEAEARFDQAGFLSKVEQGRPLIALKSAASLDGRIATASGHSQWITGPEARQRGHMLRAEYDAIIVGIGTALADDPSLNCRVAGLGEASPLRIVIDSKLQLDPASDLAKRACDQPAWVFTTEAASAQHRSRLEALGLRIIDAATDQNGRVDVKSVAHKLGEEGVTRALIEGGGGLAASFLQADLIDRVHSFRAGLIIGGDGRAAIGPLGLDRVDDAPRFIEHNTRQVGVDSEQLFVRQQ
jgi:diaminohydroxyphosphoribosylaminopyrimidine deaminase / 5-amino-6-(5-phosphoribosylamino)uracil reductase